MMRNSQPQLWKGNCHEERWTGGYENTSKVYSPSQLGIKEENRVLNHGRVGIHWWRRQNEAGPSTGCTGISVNETRMNKRLTEKWDGHERGGCTAAQGESRRALNLRLSKDLPRKALGRQWRILSKGERWLNMRLLFAAHKWEPSSS